MDLPTRKKLPHTIPQWAAEGSWFFITVNCVPPGKNQLCHAGTVCLCRIMHAIIAFPREPVKQTTVKNWKRFVAGNHGVGWQRDFFDHRLRNHHELEEKTSYILMNPVRKDLCERAEDWVWVYRPNDQLPPLLD